jgi:hypothetical protein
VHLYYDKEGSGPAWDEAKSLEYVTFHAITLPTTVNGHSIEDHLEFRINLFKLETLQAKGGIFCDLEFLFLRSFEYLKQYKAIMSVQCKTKKKLSFACIGAEANSLFIFELLEEYRNWTPQERNSMRYTHFLPWHISQKHGVYLIQRPLLFPWCISNRTFFMGPNAGTKKAIAVYMWPSQCKSMTLESLRVSNLSDIIERILTKKTQSRIKCVEFHKYITFD